MVYSEKRYDWVDRDANGVKNFELIYMNQEEWKKLLNRNYVQGDLNLPGRLEQKERKSRIAEIQMKNKFFDKQDVF
ncbi:unnamed protein product [Paramecium pentaurelia]|uniref:Uncharacterized protein n=1 Tax=Paramecium pentaurelia TaxID=43138 RepID=A0A8S1SVQ3_9CILI|nr:unnamed protein product [Paramecium pentaurelia]